MTDTLRHPRVESAMTKDDVKPGVAFITYVPGDHVVEAGTFVTEPTYDGETDDRWTATAEIKLGKNVVSKTIYLFDAGITPDDSGERWSDNVTIVDDSDSVE